MVEKLPVVTDEMWGMVNPENIKYTNDFLKQNIHLSPETLLQYTSALRIYYWWIKENAENKSFRQLKSRDFLKFQNFLTERGLSSAAIKMKRSAVSSFNNYIEIYYQDEFETFRNYITKGIPNPTPNVVHKKEPLTMDEYINLCERLKEQGHVQQLAYLKFSFSSAARRAEARQLLKSDVKNSPKILVRNGEEIKIYPTSPIRCKGRGKQGKIRSLQFDEGAKVAIEEWLSIRGEDDCPFVFVAKHSEKYEQVAKSTFNNWTEVYFESIVGRRVHPHLFRSTRATILTVEQGRDIRAAQKLLGHSSSVTTESYVIRKDNEDADDAFI